MNLLAIIIILLAVITAGSIAFIAWELSSGKPVFKQRESKASDPSDSTSQADKVSGGDKPHPD